MCIDKEGEGKLNVGVGEVDEVINVSAAERLTRDIL